MSYFERRLTKGVRKPRSVYKNFEVISCWGEVTGRTKDGDPIIRPLYPNLNKEVEEDLKNWKSELRRDLRDRFADSKPGIYSYLVWTIGRGICLIRFEKVK